MPTSPSDRPALQLAVDRANAAIRDHLRSLPGFRPVTAEQRVVHAGLVDAYMAAVAARDGGREAEEEPARAA